MSEKSSVGQGFGFVVGGLIALILVAVLAIGFSCVFGSCRSPFSSSFFTASPPAAKEGLPPLPQGYTRLYKPEFCAGKKAGETFSCISPVDGKETSCTCW